MRNDGRTPGTVDVRDSFDPATETLGRAPMRGLDRFNVAELLDRVLPRIGDSRDHDSPPGRGSTRNEDHRGSPDGCPDPVEVILYPTPNPLFTTMAIEKLRLVLARLYGDRVTLTIHNHDPDHAASNAEAEGSAGTTDGAERPQGPRTRILAHVTSPALLLELLADCARG